MTSKYLDPWGWFTRTGKHPLQRVQSNHPFAHLHHEMDRMFDDFFTHLGMDPERTLLPYTEMSVFPKVDVSETDSAYHITAELPGVEENEAKAELSEGVLTISGEKKSEHEIKDKKCHRVERTYGAFSRAIPLPVNADPKTVKAKMSKGILSIDINKKLDAKSNVTKIDIETE